MAKYSPVYWLAIVLAFVFLIIDIFSDSSVWNYLCIAAIVVAVFVRPGGFTGTRTA
jgi:hypothetical protein